MNYFSFPMLDNDFLYEKIRKNKKGCIHMTKIKIVISTYEEDEQIDVEVYRWDREKETKGKFISELSYYAFQTEKEAKEYITKLKGTYEVMQEINENEEEQKQKEEIQQLKLPELKLSYHTYEMSLNDFEEYITNYLSKKCNETVHVDFSLLEDGIERECIWFEIHREENSESVMQFLSQVYNKKESETLDVTEEVLRDIFHSPKVDCYFHPTKGYMDTIVFQVPVK